jgi:LacI family transcriptional regulator
MTNAVTISDVARAAGVSIATVSRVLNRTGNVDPALAGGVRQAAEALGYRKNDLASALRAGRRTLIGAVIPDLMNPFFTAVIRGVEDTVGPSGYLLLLCNTDENLDRESAYLAQLAGQHLAGLMIAPTSEHHTEIRRYFPTGTPVVAVDRRPRDRDVHSVTLDNRGGAKRLVNNLMARAERIGMIGGPLESTTGQERWSGFRLALEAAGRRWRAEDVRHGPYTEEFGYSAARELLHRTDRPDGLFLGNNRLAFGALRAIKDLGLSGSALQLGFFDPIPWPADLTGHIVSLSGPAYELGVRAGQILLSHIEHGEDVPLHIELDTGSVATR